MSRLVMGITGVLALSLISGAAEFARGRDLSSVPGHFAAGSAAPATQGISRSSNLPGVRTSSVNRGSKSDRATISVRHAAVSTRTVSLKLDGFADTSFLVRIPIAIADPPAAAAPAKPAMRSRPTVACEPVVSILTEVAKRLGPGRCVT